VIQDRASRGSALLFTLGAMVIAVTAASISARALIDRSINAKTQLRSDHAADLLRATEPAIISWLSTDSNGVVLPPDATEPRVDVLADRWSEGDDTIELRITAWDQDGMLPLRVLTERRELLRLCPSRVSETLDSLEIQPNAKPGLDMFGAGYRVLPTPVGDEWITFGTDIRPATQASSDADVDFDDTPTIGAMIATHPSNPGVVSLNINTTPIPLLGDVMRLAGRGGIEQIIQARAEGRVATAERSGRTARQTETTRYEFRTSSGSWAFRIDARVGSVRRVWWEVWTRSGHGWERRQRLAF